MLLVLAQVAQAATLSTCGTAPTTGCFPTVGGAVAAAAPGDTVSLTAGTYAEQVAITGDLALVADGAVRWVDPPDAIDGAVVEVADATVTISGVAFATTRVRPLLSVDADVTLEGCQLQSTAYQAEGGLVHATRGRIALNDSQLGDATADMGAHIWATDADIELVYSVLRGGVAWSSGGSIFLRGEDAAPEIWADGARIEGNWALYEGGALHGSGDLGAITLVDTAVVDNESTIEGIVSVDSGSVEVLGGQIARNTGGVLFALLADLRLDGAWLADNEGVGVQTRAGALEIVETALVRNEGTAVETNGGPTTITRSVFCANHAANGAGLVLTGGADGAEVWNNLFYANVADERGAAMALSVSAGSRATVAHNDFLDNVAAQGPAVWWHASTDGDWDVAFVNNVVAHQVATAQNVPTDWTFAFASVVQVFPRLDGNLFWDNQGGDVKEWAVGPVVYADPVMPYWSASGGCPDYSRGGTYGVDEAVHVSWYGPAVDAGVDTLDPDGSTGDIGATGGPLAHASHWGDSDADGWPWVYDCYDAFGDGAETHPEAEDPPYDWNDQDCDLTSDLDADKDGHDADDYFGDDCDDDDPTIYPGAAEIPYDEIDQDCDGFDEVDHDRDGWEPPLDCDDDDPYVNPGQIDEDPAVDRDCDGVVDVRRPLVPTGCASTPVTPSLVGIVAGLLAIARGRRRFPPL